jgi:hypothetical protein
MPNDKPVVSTVKRGTLKGKKPADALTVVNATCNAGAQCPEVTGSPVANAALADLQGRVVIANNSLAAVQKIAVDQSAAEEKLILDLRGVEVALSVYESAVNGVAGGAAAVIAKAGLPSRPEAPSARPGLERALTLTITAGKNAREAVLRWPAAAGAAMYAIEVNWTPKDPAAPFVSLGTVTRRSKLVTAPAPATSFLARVASLDSDGNASDWSDPVLGTTR